MVVKKNKSLAVKLWSATGKKTKQNIFFLREKCYYVILMIPKYSLPLTNKSMSEDISNDGT